MLIPTGQITVRPGARVGQRSNTKRLQDKRRCPRATPAHIEWGGVVARRGGRLEPSPGSGLSASDAKLSASAPSGLRKPNASRPSRTGSQSQVRSRCHPNLQQRIGCKIAHSVSPFVRESSSLQKLVPLRHSFTQYSSSSRSSGHLLKDSSIRSAASANCPCWRDSSIALSAIFLASV